MSGEMLSIIVFALIIGVSILSLPKKNSEPILDLLESTKNHHEGRILGYALAPFAAFGLMTGLASKIGLSALAGLGAYVITVVIGLFIMMIIYIIVIKFFAKRHLSLTFALMKDPQLLAFSTSSSAAVMPYQLKQQKKN